MLRINYIPLSTEELDDLIPDVDAYHDAVRADIIDEAEELLAGTVDNWTEKPEFEADFLGNDIVVFGYEDIRWKWVDEGTEPHAIVAKNFPNLKFQAGWTPRTVPGSLRSGESERFPPSVTKFSVDNPGIKPRDFSGQIKERLDNILFSRATAYARQENGRLRSLARRIFKWRF